MKRYLLFRGQNCYPSGGWDDMAGDYDTLEEAREARRSDWYQIVDTSTGDIVEEG